MNKIEKFFSDYKNTITILSGFFVVITFFISADGYINRQIESKITDATYINKLSKTLRPFSIFNQDGVIIYDHGGENFIKKIHVSKNVNGEFNKIIIKTKIFFAKPPDIGLYGL